MRVVKREEGKRVKVLEEEEGFDLYFEGFD